MNNKRKRARFSANNDDSDSDEDEESEIKIQGNRIYFYCNVTKKTAINLLQKITDASKNAVLNTPPGDQAVVYIYIHSDGGDAYVGLSLFDHIQSSAVKIVTIADGFVASSASLILLAGHERWSMKNSSVLIHQIRSTFWGKFDELIDELSNSKMLMNCITNIYKNRTKMKTTKLNDLLKKELNLNAQQCLEFGFIDRII